MRLRPFRIVLPAVALALGAAACGPSGGATASGHPVNDRTATAAPATAPADGSPLSVLPPYPSGSTPWKQNEIGLMSLDGFIKRFFNAGVSKDERPLMVQRGFRSAVRRGWIGADASQSEIWVVTFRNAAGARSMYLGLTHSWSEHGGKTFPDPAAHGTGQLISTLDNLGLASGKVIGVFGNRVMYVRYFMAAEPSRSGTEALAARQAAGMGS